MSIKSISYRIQTIHDYYYYDEVYSTISALLESWGGTLHLTRGQVNKIIKRDAIINRHPHILITAIKNTT